MKGWIETGTGQRGIPLDKVRALQELGFSIEDIDELLSRATAAEKSADALGIAYKADDAGGELDQLDQAYIALRDALDAGDPDGVQQALAQMATLAGGSGAPMDVKARVLTDSGDQSVMSSASKAAADPWMTWFAGGARTTKAFDVKKDLFALALGADQK